METGLDIKEFDGLYQVSNFGNVRRLFKDKRSNPFKILKPSVNSKGYYRVQLCKDGKPKWYLVHRLVAESFINNPHNLKCVNHLDGNKTNNRVNNLEFITAKNNIVHARDILKVDFNKNHKPLVTEETLNSIQDLLNKGMALKDIFQKKLN